MHRVKPLLHRLFEVCGMCDRVGLAGKQQICQIWVIMMLSVHVTTGGAVATDTVQQRNVRVCLCMCVCVCLGVTACLWIRPQ